MPGTCTFANILVVSQSMTVETFLADESKQLIGEMDRNMKCDGVFGV